MTTTRSRQSVEVDRVVSGTTPQAIRNVVKSSRKVLSQLDYRKLSPRVCLTVYKYEGGRIFWEFWPGPRPAVG